MGETDVAASGPTGDNILTNTTKRDLYGPLPPAALLPYRAADRWVVDVIAAPCRNVTWTELGQGPVLVATCLSKQNDCVSLCTVDDGQLRSP